jgi:tRNA(Ile2) C34 agmatinyltransferase TiaS
MVKSIVRPPPRTCPRCGTGGQILLFRCKKCGNRYLGNKVHGGIH